MGRKIPEKILSEDEQKLFFEAFRSGDTEYRDYCMCRLMVDNGLRVSETTNLEMGHIEFNSHRIFIKESKGAKDRVVWADEGLLDDTKEWLKIRADIIEQKDLDVEKVNDGKNYLFISHKGKQVHPSHLRRKVKTIAKRADIEQYEKVHPHTLRHTWATDFLKNTKNLRQVQKGLGHSDVSTTQIYTHIVDEEMKESMKEFSKDRERPKPSRR